MSGEVWPVGLYTLHNVFFYAGNRGVRERMASGDPFLPHREGQILGGRLPAGGGWVTARFLIFLRDSPCFLVVLEGLLGFHACRRNLVGDRRGACGFSRTPKADSQRATRELAGSGPTCGGEWRVGDFLYERLVGVGFLLGSDGIARAAFSFPRFLLFLERTPGFTISGLRSNSPRKRTGGSASTFALEKACIPTIQLRWQITLAEDFPEPMPGSGEVRARVPRR